MKFKNLKIKDLIVTLFFLLLMAIVVIDWSGFILSFTLILYILYVVLRLFGKDELNIGSVGKRDIF